MRVLNAVRAKMQPKSTSSKVTRSARSLINRPISKVNAIVIRATTKVKLISVQKIINIECMCACSTPSRIQRKKVCKNPTKGPVDCSDINKDRICNQTHIQYLRSDIQASFNKWVNYIVHGMLVSTVAMKF